jgi:hypothetical protein
MQHMHNYDFLVGRACKIVCPPLLNIKLVLIYRFVNARAHTDALVTQIYLFLQNLEMATAVYATIGGQDIKP